LKSPLAGSAFQELFTHRRDFILTRRVSKFEDGDFVGSFGASTCVESVTMAHYAPSHFLFVAKMVDIVAVAFAHFLAVDPGTVSVEAGFAVLATLKIRPSGSGLSKGFVHFHSEIARHFDVLFLVFSNRHNVVCS